MEPLSIAGTIAKPVIQNQIKVYLERFDPNKRLEKAFEKAKEEWIIALHAALPKAFDDLNERIDELDARLSRVYDDPQFWRVIDNFTYEAFREALDERRRMFAHAAAGILDPDISIERKARVERTLRALDPEHILLLYGANQIPIGGFGQNSFGAKMAKLLHSSSAGDVLLACGCVRIEPAGGGAGQGVWAEALITQLGYDVLTVLRTYIAARELPFVVPGRESGPRDRSKQEAQAILYQTPHLRDLVGWSRRRNSGVSRHYGRSSMESPLRTVTFFMPIWAEWETRLEEMATACGGAELTMNIVRTPYQPSDSETITALRIEFVGPHDLMRHLADDCEATWHL